MNEDWARAKIRELLAKAKPEDWKHSQFFIDTSSGGMILNARTDTQSDWVKVDLDELDII